MTVKAQAYQKFVRVSPRKLRLVADIVRRQKVTDALKELHFVRKDAARLLAAVINQAKHNAEGKNANPDTLRIDTILIEDGPRFKRYRAVSRGRAHSILKRTSHIKILVAGQPKTSAAKAQEPAKKGIPTSPKKRQNKPPKTGPKERK